LIESVIARLLRQGSPCFAVVSIGCRVRESCRRIADHRYRGHASKRLMDSMPASGFANSMVDAPAQRLAQHVRAVRACPVEFESAVCRRKTGSR
jgi:hypothetical protein